MGRARAYFKRVDWEEILSTDADGVPLMGESGWWGKAYMSSQMGTQGKCMAYANHLKVVNGNSVPLPGDTAVNPLDQSPLSDASDQEGRKSHATAQLTYPTGLLQSQSKERKADKFQYDDGVEMMAPSKETNDVIYGHLQRARIGAVDIGLVETADVNNQEGLLGEDASDASEDAIDALLEEDGGELEDAVGAEDTKTAALLQHVLDELVNLKGEHANLKGELASLRGLTQVAQQAAKVERSKLELKLATEIDRRPCSCNGDTSTGKTAPFSTESNSNSGSGSDGSDGSDSSDASSDTSIDDSKTKDAWAREWMVLAQGGEEGRRASVDAEDSKSKHSSPSSSSRTRKFSALLEMRAKSQTHTAARGRFSQTVLTSPQDTQPLSMLQTGSRSRAALEMTMGGLFGKMWSKITRWVESQFRKFGETFKTQVVNPMIDKVKALVQTVKDGIEKVIDGVKAYAEQAVAWLKGLVDQVLVVVDKAKEWASAQLAKVKKTLEKPIKALGKVFKALKRGIMKAVNKIKKVIGEIKGALAKAWNYVKSLAERLKTLIKGWIDKVYAFFNKLIQTVKKELYKIKDNITKFAKDAFAGIKKLGGAIKDLWGEIKKLPELILKLVDAAIEGVLKLFDIILKPIAKAAKQDYSEITREAESNCAWVAETPVVGPLCEAGQKVVLTLWNIFTSLVDKGVDLIFRELAKIANKAFSTEAVTFGTHARAKEACFWTSYLRSSNLPGALMMYTGCVVNARGVQGLNELVHLLLDLINDKIGDQIDLGTYSEAKEISGWKHWSSLGMFGLYGEIYTRFGLRVWWGVSSASFVLIKLILKEVFNIVKVPAIPATPDEDCTAARAKIEGLHSIVKEFPVFFLEILCDVLARVAKFTVGTSIAIADLLFHELSKVLNTLFDIEETDTERAVTFGTQERALEACRFAAMSLPAKLAMRVGCVVHARLVQGLKEMLHLLLDLVGRTITDKIGSGDDGDARGISFGTRAQAQDDVEWKHWVHLGLFGVHGEALASLALRLWWGWSSAVFFLAAKILGFIGIDAPPIPATPDPVCPLARTKLEGLHKFVKELPMFLVTIVCDVLVRAVRFAVGVGLKIVDRGLDYIIMTLNGEGPIFDISTKVFAAALEAAAGMLVSAGGNFTMSDVMAIMDGSMPNGMDLSDAFANVTLFGLPKPASDLALDVMVPASMTGLKYMRAQSLLATVMMPGRSGPNPAGAVVKNTSEDLFKSANTSIAETTEKEDDDTDSPTPSLLEVAATQRQGAKKWFAKPNSFLAGKNLGSLGNGIGIGGPVEVRQSYGHKLVIHSRVMHPSFSNANKNHNSDKIAMCLGRHYDLYEVTPSGDIDVECTIKSEYSLDAKGTSDAISEGTQMKTAYTAGTCIETATTSVPADKTACDAVAVRALHDNVECSAVMTNADNAVKACTYTKPVVDSDSRHIQYWLQEAAGQAQKCYLALGRDIRVDMRVDADCSEGGGGPFELNNEEWSLEGMDECHDTDTTAEQMLGGVLKTAYYYKAQAENSQISKSKAPVGPSGRRNAVTPETSSGVLSSVLSVAGTAGDMVVRNLCPMWDRLNAEVGGSDTDDLQCTIRMCNMESLVLSDAKSPRPFFGVVEFHQFGNVASRNAFGEFGFSAEFTVSLLSEMSMFGKMFGRMIPKIAERAKNAKKALGKTTAGVMGGILKILTNFILSIAIARNKAGYVEFIIDVPSFKQIPNMFGFKDGTTHTLDKEGDSADAAHNAMTNTYLFAIIAMKDPTGKTNDYSQQACLMGRCWGINKDNVSSKGLSKESKGSGRTTGASFFVTVAIFNLLGGHAMPGSSDCDFEKDKDPISCPVTKNICQEAKAAADTKKATADKKGGGTSWTNNPMHVEKKKDRKVEV
jgi:hypothetical protein